MTNAANLRARVVFEKRGEGADGFGNTQTDWVAKFIVWAQITPRLGGEQVMASRLSGVQPFTITVRSSLDTRAVDPSWRIRNERTDVIYNIRSGVNPDQKNQYLDLLVDSGGADG